MKRKISKNSPEDHGEKSKRAKQEHKTQTFKVDSKNSRKGMKDTDADCSMTSPVFAKSMRRSRKRKSKVSSTSSSSSSSSSSTSSTSSSSSPSSKRSTTDANKKRRHKHRNDRSRQRSSSESSDTDCRKASSSRSAKHSTSNKKKYAKHRSRHRKPSSRNSDSKSHRAHSSHSSKRSITNKERHRSSSSKSSVSLLNQQSSDNACDFSSTGDVRIAAISQEEVSQEASLLSTSSYIATSLVCESKYANESPVDSEDGFKDIHKYKSQPPTPDLTLLTRQINRNLQESYETVARKDEQKTYEENRKPLRTWSISSASMCNRASDADLKSHQLRRLSDEHVSEVRSANITPDKNQNHIAVFLRPKPVDTASREGRCIPSTFTPPQTETDSWASLSPKSTTYSPQLYHTPPNYAQPPIYSIINAANGFPRTPFVHQDFRSQYSKQSPQNVPCLFRRKSYGLPAYDEDEFTTLDDNNRFIDTHCHLDFLFKREDFKGSFHNYQAVNRSTFTKSFEGCVAIFCDPKTFGKSTVWSSLLDEPNVWAAFGCHPHMANDYDDVVERHLFRALEHPKVVALGEIGLDYSHKNTCDREKQKIVFERQLRIAVEKGKPLVIHSRNSTSDTLEILKRLVPRDHKIHRHCFTGDYAEALDWLNAFPKLFIGLTALVTFPSATTVHDVARNINLDRLLLETDAPYFVPKHLSKNMKFSHPGMGIHVAAQIAALRSDALLEDVIRTTRKNTKEMYNI